MRSGWLLGLGRFIVAMGRGVGGEMLGLVALVGLSIANIDGDG